MFRLILFYHVIVYHGRSHTPPKKRFKLKYSQKIKLQFYNIVTSYDKEDNINFGKIVSHQNNISYVFRIPQPMFRVGLKACVPG